MGRRKGEELREALRERGANEALRKLAVRLVLDKGMRPAEVAGLPGRGEDWAGTWVARYAEGGLAALRDLPRPGATPLPAIPAVPSAILPRAPPPARSRKPGRFCLATGGPPEFPIDLFDPDQERSLPLGCVETVSGAHKTSNPEKCFYGTPCWLGTMGKNQRADVNNPNNPAHAKDRANTARQLADKED